MHDAGMLIGLAIYNRVLLDVQLPLCVYMKLLNPAVTLTLDDLAAVDPAVGTSMRALLAYSGTDVEVSLEYHKVPIRCLPIGFDSW